MQVVKNSGRQADQAENSMKKKQLQTAQRLSNSDKTVPDRHTESQLVKKK